MKAVQFKSFGLPPVVADCIDLPEPGKAEAGQVVIDVLATPINPSDIMTVLGLYGTLPKLPATPGNEGIGRVVDVGAGVEHLKVGDLTLLPVGVGAWTTRIAAPAAKLLPMPEGIDVQQLSMLTINPPTALLLLRDVVELKEGDWVMQNAANSAVGTYLIKLAKLRGIKTVNVVRRDSLIEPQIAECALERWHPSCPLGFGQHVGLIKKFTERWIDRANGFRCKRVGIRGRRAQMHDDGPVSAALRVVDELGQRMTVIGRLRRNDNTE